MSAPTCLLGATGRVQPGAADADRDARDLIAELRAMGLQVELQSGLAVVHPIDTLDLEARALVANLSHVMARAIAQECVDQLPPDPAPGEPLLRLCGHCRHLLRRGTCAEPVAAGLIEAGAGFGIAWPTQWRASTCLAFTDRRGDRID